MRYGSPTAILALILGLAAHTEAASITYGPFPYSVPVTGGVVPVSFPQYDLSLGPLTSVTYFFDAMASTSAVTLQNPSSTAIQSFAHEAYLSNTVTTPNFVSKTPVPPPPPLGTMTLPANGSISFMQTISSSRQTDTFGPPPPAGFVGTGTLAATLNISMQFVFNGIPSGITPSVQFTSPGTITGTFSVTYNSIPEPSSAVLLGLGFGVMTLAALRRAWYYKANRFIGPSKEI
jgi:hypothetical protein